MRLVGKNAPTFLKRWISRPKEGPLLHLPDIDLRLPIVSKTNYLDITISYNAFANDTVIRRVTAANVCFRILRPWLMDTHHPFHVRIRLYNQCVLPTVSYGIHEMGITAKGFQQIVGMIHRHHRTMARSPVHITRETTQAFYTRLNLNRPWLYLQQQQSRLTQSLSLRRADLTQLAMQSSTPDICVLTPDYPENHITIPASIDDPCPQAPVLKCPKCDRAYFQVGPWKCHMRESHGIPCMIEDLFVPLRDTINGRAVCRHCHKAFTDIYIYID